MEDDHPTVWMVLDATLDLVRADAVTLLVIAVVGAGYALLWRRGKALGVDDHRWLATAIPVLIVAFAAAAGLKAALDQASMVDDAFISFRYARHWVDGHGLVFNIGERVEGYTNFLWVVILAAVMKATPWDAPEIALFGCLLCFVANLVVIALAGRRLAANSTLRPYLPVAVMVLCAHWAFTSFATTGMETMLSSLLVNLGVLALLGRGGARNAALAGCAWIAATLSRPDHSLFYVAGGVAVLVDAVIGYRRAQRDGGRCAGPATPRQLLWTWSKPLLAYAAPFFAYLVYAGWKLQYYGSLIPNTYYAKSADEAYWSQGLVYAATFYLGSHFWIPAAMMLAWLLLRTQRDATRRLQVFTAVAFVLFNVYVAKVGGDFMYGRFYISLLPLALLGAEGLLHALAPRPEGRRSRPRLVAMVVLAAALAASAHGVHLIPEGRVRWHLADEGSVYRLEQRLPVVVQHPVYRIGNFFGDVLTDRGIEPTIAASGIGMMGYYSRLPLIDLRGLTDATIARREVQGRHRPGHEKWSSRAYLVERDVDFIRGKRKAQYRDELRLQLGPHSGHVWLIHTYDPELMATIKRDVPEIGFVDFEAHLDHYIATLDDHEPREVRKDLRWFRAYYFAHVDDQRRERTIEDWLATHQPER